MRSECDPDELDSRFHVTVNEDDVNVSILSTCGAMCSSWYDGTSDRSFMVDPLSYFSFQPVLHDWCNKRLWYVLSCLWDDAYKRTLAANRQE